MTVTAQTPLTKLFNQDLAGWKLTHGYILQRDHTLAGCFPVLDTRHEGSEGLVMCIDEDTWRKVWELLDEPLEAKFTKHTILLAPDGRFAYDISDERFDRTPLHITTLSDVETLTPENSPFKWAVGLLSFRDESNAQFPPFPKSDD